MKNVVKFIMLWVMMVFAAVLMPILTVMRYEVKMSVKKV